MLEAVAHYLPGYSVSAIKGIAANNALTCFCICKIVINALRCLVTKTRSQTHHSSCVLFHSSLAFIIPGVSNVN